ncbi:MAG: nitrous oxide reductase family maturation protein NosD [Candidatus Heimdallarchaeota archaeon]
MIPKRYHWFLVTVLILNSLAYLILWGRAELTARDKITPLQSRNALYAKLPPKPQIATVKSPLQYVPHTPIHITKNADFTALGFPGEGTPSDPYIIEGLNITNATETQNLITIHDTTAYFLIRNNLLNGTRHMKSYTTRESYGYGIYLYNAVHGTIDTNIITNCSYGIFLHWNSRATVAHNIVSNNTVGIYLQQVSGNTVTYNAVSDCWAGIFLEASDQSTLTHNTISNCLRGFYLRDSEQNTILDNTMLNTGLFIHS